MPRQLIPWAVAALALSLPACGNSVTTEVSGATGLTQSSDGTVKVLVNGCGKGVNRIDVSAGREELEDTETNPVLGRLHCSETRSGHLEAVIPGPSEGCTAERPWTLPTDPVARIIVSATEQGEDRQTRQVSATMDQVRALRADQVLIGDGEVVPLAAFNSMACGNRA